MGSDTSDGEFCGGCYQGEWGRLRRRTFLCYARVNFGLRLIYRASECSSNRNALPLWVQILEMVSFAVDVTRESGEC